MKIMDNIWGDIKSNDLPECFFILLPMKLVARVYSDGISKSQLLITAKKHFEKCGKSGIKSSSKGSIVLMVLIPVQLTMILTQESHRSYPNTLSQRLTELSKYKAGLLEDESKEQTMF